MLSNLNPFSTELDKGSLYNIKTEKAASNKITDFLVSVLEEGNELRERFIAECSKYPDRFKKPIKKRMILNFTSATTKKKVKCSNKVQEIKMQRDLFGHLLALSLQHEVDLAKVLSYPNTTSNATLSPRWYHM